MRSTTATVARYPRLASAVLVVASLWGVPARAAPQVNVGVLPGVAYSTQYGFGFSGAVCSDVLFGRNGAHDVGFGPRVELGTYAFDDFRALLGPTFQLGLDPIDIQPTVSALMRLDASGVRSGVAARLFVGVRPYNYTFPYGAAAGLSFGVEHVFAASSEQTFLVAAQLDAMWLSLPFLVLIGLF